MSARAGLDGIMQVMRITKPVTTAELVLNGVLLSTPFPKDATWCTAVVEFSNSFDSGSALRLNVGFNTDATLIQGAYDASAGATLYVGGNTGFGIAYKPVNPTDESEELKFQVAVSAAPTGAVAGNMTVTISYVSMPE